MDSSFCYTEHRGDKYKFFENIDEYLHYYKFCNNNNDECNQYKYKCHSVGSLLEEKKYELINICERLNYLINQLFYSINSQDDERHLLYLNYWLNHELHNIRDNICPKTFFQYMRIGDMQNNALSNLKSKSYYIKKEEVNNINSLYYLYYYYNEIKKVLDYPEPKQKLVESYANYCVEKYKDLRAKCIEKDENLCNALDVFKRKYEKTDIKKEKLSDWTIEKLPSLYDVEDNKTPDTVNSDIETTNLLGGIIATEIVGQPSEIVMLPEDPVRLPAESLITNTIQQGNVLEKLKGDEMLHEMNRRTVNTEDALDNNTQKIVGPVIGTLGLTSIFFTFYKFTSFGSRLLRGRRSKNKMSYDLNEYRNNFLNNSEYDPILPNNLSYNIAYNSS
ncbi:PIR protein [Plasmodium vivax]|nr:PIR protein [Plasmodium vivax]